MSYNIIREYHEDGDRMYYTKILSKALIDVIIPNLEFPNAWRYVGEMDKETVHEMTNWKELVLRLEPL